MLSVDFTLVAYLLFGFNWVFWLYVGLVVLALCLCEIKIKTMVIILLFLALIGVLILTFTPSNILDKPISPIKEKEIDKTTYTNDILSFYYVDKTKESYFYHKGRWYLRSENPKRDKYLPCGTDTSRWLDKKLASIELTEKYKDFKQKGL